MNVFAKFDEIPSMILEVIKETKRYGQTVGRSFGRSVGQRENSIPSHKHSLRGYNYVKIHMCKYQYGFLQLQQSGFKVINIFMLNFTEHVIHPAH